MRKLNKHSFTRYKTYVLNINNLYLVLINSVNLFLDY